MISYHLIFHVAQIEHLSSYPGFVFYPFVRVILVKSVDFVQFHLIRDGPFGWDRLCDLPFGRTLSHGHLSFTICSSDLAHLPDLVPFFYF